MGRILTSADGVTWTSRTSGPADASNGVTYGNGTFIAVGGGGTILQSDSVWDSACAATLGDDLSIHIPIVTYASTSYWADMQPVPDTLDWAIAAAGKVTNKSVYNGCTPSSLSNDFKPSTFRPS